LDAIRGGRSREVRNPRNFNALLGDEQKYMVIERRASGRDNKAFVADDGLKENEPRPQREASIAMDSPAVSVVMSVCNGETFLTDAIGSILQQTFRDFEFIIIDDGSTDKTGEVLSYFAKCDNRIRLFTQENKGRAEALNWGIELARAPLIARMDADDMSYPYRLKAQVDFLKTHPNVGLAG